MKEAEKNACKYFGLKMNYDVITGPSGTIIRCFITDCFGNDIAEGISICSPLDVFDMEYGKDLAFGRAFKAMIRGENVSPIVDRDRIEYNLAAKTVSMINNFKGIFIQNPVLMLEF